MLWSRKHRVWFPGTKYHITSCGNRRLSIIYDDFDREVYLQFLEEASHCFPFSPPRLLSYDQSHSSSN